MPRLTLPEVRALAFAALRGSGASEIQAVATADSVEAAEADGIRTVGLGYLPTYCEHLRCGKVKGDARPSSRLARPGLVLSDAALGFCHPAFIEAKPAFLAAAKSQGPAALLIGRSYSAGVVAWFVEQLADAGLVALAFANASPSVAPWGGSRPFFGTNPLAFAAPRAGRPPLVIDQATSQVAWVTIRDHAERALPVPPTWGYDAAGTPTEDPQAIMDGGSLAPHGGYKGFALGLMVDILAAGLVGAHWSFQSSGFGDNEGGPPAVGQCFIAIDPTAFGDGGFGDRLEIMLAALLAQPGVRLPGERRLLHREKAAAEGVEVPGELLARLRAYAG